MVPDKLRQNRRLWPRRVRLSISIAGMLALTGVHPEPPVFRAGDFRATSRADARRLALPKPGRPVYPYSVIRGGAYSPGELIHALNADPVAARHYAGFRRSLVHTTDSRFANAVYLSYRVGDAVYWTSRAVRVPRGETLLTDGRNYARARCGNRISPTPQTPVSDLEPAPLTLDQPSPPAGVRNPDAETWAETHLLTDLAPPFTLVPANLPSTSAATGASPTPAAGNAPYWSIGAPGGFLYPGNTGPAPSSSTGVPPTTPAAGTTPAPAGGSPPSWSMGPPIGFVYTGNIASELAPKLTPPGIVGEVIQPNPIPGFVFPPGQTVAPPTFEMWPTVPLPPSGPPGNPTPPGYLPPAPGPEVPEPGLLPPMILAVLAAIARVRRRSAGRGRRTRKPIRTRAPLSAHS
jgi:hypothetical protein